MNYLPDWYSKSNCKWSPWKSVTTINDNRLSSLQHRDVAKHHSELALSERLWRRGLLESLNDEDHIGVEPPTCLKKEKGNKGFGGILLGSWNASVEREFSHISAMDAHLKQRQIKEEQLLRVLEG